MQGVTQHQTAWTCRLLAPLRWDRFSSETRREGPTTVRSFKRELSPHADHLILLPQRFLPSSYVGSSAISKSFIVCTRMKRNTKISMPVDRSSVTNDNVVGGSRQKKVGYLKSLSNPNTNRTFKAKQEISRNSFGKGESRKDENHHGV